MRHEQAIQLEEHPVRKVLLDLYNDLNGTIFFNDGRSDRSLYRVMMQFADTMPDFDTIEKDFDFPTDWSRYRKAAFMFATVSEHQLLQYLKFLKSDMSTPPLCMDKLLNWIAGIKPVGKEAK